ncbi:unnamed protein product [marine sediment metagenome]|uniref:Uncharacterized protein n=1 Tax=marine sediment metagenome TaxID=412755 RepID=X1HKZ0_9ZZZZ
MKQNVRDNSSGPNRIMSRLAAEKKKTITALSLIAVMVFMWVKVLGGKTPQSAEATLMAQKANLDTSRVNSELKTSFIELPKVKGRNDVLTRDFFAADGWQVMRGGEVNVVSKDGSEGVVTRIAKKLNLEAIGLGKNPQAFINDKLLSVGDKLLVRDGVNTYECEVIGIEENTVSVRYGEVEIQLKLAQENERTG